MSLPQHDFCLANSSTQAHSQTQGRRQVRKCGVDTHGEHAEREPITGSGDAAPSGSLQGQCPCLGVRGKAPEAENLLAFDTQRKQQICFILRILHLPKPNHPIPSSRIKAHRTCINLRNDLWQKWGGHVHPSPPRGGAPGQTAATN